MLLLSLMLLRVLLIMRSIALRAFDAVAVKVLLWVRWLPVMLVDEVAMGNNVVNDVVEGNVAVGEVTLCDVGG